MLGQYWPLSLFSQTRMVLRENVKTCNSKTLSCVSFCSLCHVIRGAFLIYRALNAFLIFYFRFVLTHHAVREVHTWCKNGKYSMEISTEESPRLGLGLILVRETSHSSLQSQCSILFMKRHWRQQADKCINSILKSLLLVTNYSWQVTVLELCKWQRSHSQAL